MNKNLIYISILGILLVGTFLIVNLNNEPVIQEEVNISDIPEELRWDVWEQIKERFDKIDREVELNGK